MFKKGVTSANPRGRPRGPNKTTRDMREFYNAFLEQNVDQMQSLLDQVANGIVVVHKTTAVDGTVTEKMVPIVEPNPSAALKLLIDLSEYCVPKLARAEITGANGGPIIAKIVEEVVTVSG